MLFLGVALGVLLAAVVVGGWLLMRSGRSGPVVPYLARQTIWDIERRTIHDLLTAEFVAERQGAVQFDQDVEEGS